MRKNKKEMGFTLVELVFVVAIILVLAGIFLPIGLSKLEKADDARATADTQAIAAGLASFFDDLRHFPACNDGSNCNTLNDDANNLKFLAFGDGTGDLGSFYPGDNTLLDTLAAGKWDLANEEEGNAPDNNAYNHLVTNDPDGDGVSDNPTTDYKTTGSRKWDGPYMAKLDVDPFGQTYVAHVGAMEESGLPIPGAGNGEGWILSAGPDATLDTGTTATSISGDDIGFIFFSR